MKKIWSIIVAMAMLVGCTRADAQARKDTIASEPIKAPANIVRAEARVEPSHWTDLSFAVAGDVREVLIEPGDQVREGSPLVRLETRELVLLFQSAQQDLAAQQAAYDMLLKGPPPEAIARSDKENADRIAQAQVALYIQELQLQKAQATDPDAEVEAAKARVTQLELQLARVRAQNPAPSLVAAQVGLERAQLALEETQDEYTQALDRPWEDQSVRDHWAKRLRQAKLDHRLAQAQLDAVHQAGQAYELEQATVAAQLRQARLQVDHAIAARETYTVTLDALSAEVQAAGLQLEALRAWDNPYRDAPQQEEIAQAEAQVRKAEVAVQRMQIRLDEAELCAPLTGTVVRVDVTPGDRVAPGQIVVVVAALDKLCVRTTDLTELDVVRVALDAPATVKADALSAHQFKGRVSQIDLRGDQYRGDTVYRVEVELIDPPVDTLRWGMTAVVEIEVP
jgi:multidrug efflux pump subunit AcrA (membrane-fusion protein)